MESKSSIPIIFSEFKHQAFKPEDVRFSREPSNAELVKAIADIQENLRRISDEASKFYAHYNSDNVFKSNSLKRAIEQITVSQADAVVNNITTSMAGSSSGTGSNLERVSKTVVADTVYPEVFSAPALLLMPPIVYDIVDGMQTAQWAKLESETVSGFTATPPISGTMRYTYLLL